MRDLPQGPIPGHPPAMTVPIAIGAAFNYRLWDRTWRCLP